MAPRINAAGRLDSADPAVELLLCEDIDEAESLANEIDRLNKERQGIVQRMTKEAIDIVEKQFPPEKHHVLVVAKEGWNAGVIGIVASRLVEQFYRPTIVLSIDSEKGLAKGSARSIEGFDMFHELSKSRDILPHFGGHPMAAGLTMKAADLDMLRVRLHEQAAVCLKPEDFTPIMNIDVVAGVEEISLDVIEQMQRLAPFGVANPTPKVMIEDAQIGQMRRIGSDGNHLKLSFAENGVSLMELVFTLAISMRR